MFNSNRKNKRRLRIGLLATVFAGSLVVPALLAPVIASDVFVFYSLKNRDVWESVQPALAGHEVQAYKVDLLAVADYSAKQKIVARADRSGILLVVGVRAGQILSDAEMVVPLVGVEISDALRTSADVLIYLNHEIEAPDVAGDPIRIHSAADLEHINLHKTRLLRVDPSAELNEILEALLRRLSS